MVGGGTLVREFNVETDCHSVEMVERRCDVASGGKISLYTDVMGDPICRVRHSPSFLMLVAETSVEKEIVGLIRGCIKTVTCGKKLPRNSRNGESNGKQNQLIPLYTKAAYILGLRVSPSHRRMGIGLKLVTRLESWFRENGAEYSYMATESDNEASIKLFTERCNYIRFRTPTILVQPVHAHRKKISRRVSIFQLDPREAEILYRQYLSTTEFFPRDIDSILNNKLNLGTFLAVSAPEYTTGFPGVDEFLANPPSSWAVVSVWNSKDVYRLEVKGVSRIKTACAKAIRIVDKALPWLKIPSVPEVFRPFGMHCLYGLVGHGEGAVGLVRALCMWAHNLARESGCGVVAVEVARRDPLRLGIPHWETFSCAEDLWCMKRLGEDYSDGAFGDWTKSSAGTSIFVDPREF